MSKAGGVSVVSGQIIIAPAVPAFSGATAHIFLEDISRADADAHILAQTAVAGLAHASAAGGETIVLFRLAAAKAAVNPRGSYNVRVWVDVDGDGRKSANDLHSDEVYPVLTRGFGSKVVVRLGPRS
jgi:uncharacterized lipoprotein YbaY